MKHANIHFVSTLCSLILQQKFSFATSKAKRSNDSSFYTSCTREQVYMSLKVRGP